MEFLSEGLPNKASVTDCCHLSHYITERVGISNSAFFSDKVQYSPQRGKVVHVCSALSSSAASTPFPRAAAGRTHE